MLRFLSHILADHTSTTILEDSPKTINICEEKVIYYNKTPMNQTQESKNLQTNQKQCLPLSIFKSANQSL